MEKQQRGFFSSLKGQVVRGVRSRSSSPARTDSSLMRRKKHSGDHCAYDDSVPRSGSLTLAPLMEGPDPQGRGGRDPNKSSGGSGLGHWMRGKFSRSPSVNSVAGKRSDLKLMLGVLGAPLAPIRVSSLGQLPLLSVKDTPIETSSAQYILQQFTAASGGAKLQNSIKNAYALGKLKMVTSEYEDITGVIKNQTPAQTGGFVLWQMNPDMWYVELVVGDSKVHAGCNGKMVWRHTPWLGAYAAKGPVRPLRRSLQGLDPRATASLFADATCRGQKTLNGEDCFILKLSIDSETLKFRSDGPAEIIRHVLFGYFSQKTGLLVRMEDSQLTRIHSNGDATYWETTITSFLEDYKPVEGMMIAHSGRSIATLYRFGETAMSHTKTKMEECWTIEEVAFNVPGLSLDCFIPPADLRSGSVISDTHNPPHLEETVVSHGAKIAALEKSHDVLIGGRWKFDEGQFIHTTDPTK